MISSGLARRRDDAPVTVASFPTPYEAELARAALESHGLTALVGTDHGQYVSAAPWVRLQVPRSDAAFATSILDEGPPGATSAMEEAEDDMRPLRLRRRFVVARWFLYSGAAMCLVTGSKLTMPLFFVLLGLAIWSRTQPRYAFGAALVIQAALTVATISTRGIVGLGMVIPLIAFQFAWMSASPKHARRLQASPLPAAPGVEIGEVWMMGGADREPVERPLWWVRSLTVLVAVLIFLSFFYWSLTS